MRRYAGRGDTVAVLGMTYRPDTYIVEEAAGLHVAQSLKRSGCRVLVHDFAANSTNSPALLEFEAVSDPAHLGREKNLKAIVICCPWAGYRKLNYPAGVPVLDPWGVRA